MKTKKDSKKQTPRKLKLNTQDLERITGGVVGNKGGFGRGGFAVSTN